jgi:hypothetical protein
MEFARLCNLCDGNRIDSADARQHNSSRYQGPIYDRHKGRFVSRASQDGLVDPHKRVEALSPRECKQSARVQVRNKLADLRGANVRPASWVGTGLTPPVRVVVRGQNRPTLRGEDIPPVVQRIAPAVAMSTPQPRFYTWPARVPVY